MNIGLAEKNRGGLHCVHSVAALKYVLCFMSLIVGGRAFGIIGDVAMASANGVSQVLATGQDGQWKKKEGRGREE